jgi:hypothetical protein
MRVIKQAIKMAKEIGPRAPDADPPADIARPGWVTIEQCARLIGLNKFTLYHWRAEGRLNEATGLRRLGRRRYRVDWAVFRAAVDAGRLG